jgi:hypothetical protein
MSKILLTIALLCITSCSFATADSGNNFLKTADIQPTATEASKDKQLVIDITRGLLQISERVAQNLSRFLPASKIPTINRVNQHFSQLMVELDTQPDTVLSATQDDQLESLLKEFGPSDPFSSLPFISVDELKPGDIILRCSSALSSQMTELMIWSRYTHSALYIGNGMIIDSTWKYGVKARSLADLLNESNRVGVLRIQGLTSDQADKVVLAAQSKESAEYNFENVKLLGVQKLDVLTNISRQSLGDMIGILGRAEYLPPDATDNGKYACSELIVSAFKAVNITLSHANGFTPGDIIRLSQAGFISEVGRLQIPTKQ